ncbi:MAG: dihydroorotase family protein [Candidatus Micrarchaeota archaeon]
MIIKDGKVFFHGDFVQKDILIEDGKIVKIGNNISGESIVNAAGKLVLPGLIDPHVHLREPGATEKEDFLTGSKAAIAGGFTTVIDMPNNSPPTTTAEALMKKGELSKKALCNVLFHFGATDDNFEEVKLAHPDSLKIYLGKTTGNMVLQNPGSLEKHYDIFPKDKPIVLHACDHSENEDENLTRTYKTIKAAIALAKSKGRKIHLAHAATKKELALARPFPNVTVEVAPHYLFLSTKDLPALGTKYKVYPPLKSEQKRLMLLSAFEEADCIATDHAPHTLADKEMGAAGFPGLETSLALMLTACNNGLLTRSSVIKKMSENPASIFGISGKGKIEEGFDGDITIVDPKKEWKVKGSELETKCKWSPFEGKTLTGKVYSVIRSGKTVFENYTFI